MDTCRAALSVLPRLILAATAVRATRASLAKSSAAARVHAVAMEFRLWRLLAVVAAVLLAGGHLAATRGMGAVVLIGLCVRHMRPPRIHPTRDGPLASITGGEFRLPGLGPQGVPPFGLLKHLRVLRICVQTFERSTTAPIVQHRVR